jgi:hypothetical protein
MTALLIVVFAVVCSFKDQGLGFACGGSGSLFKTQDGGKSWKRDKVHSSGWLVHFVPCEQTRLLESEGSFRQHNLHASLWAVGHGPEAAWLWLQQPQMQTYSMFAC